MDSAGFGTVTRVAFSYISPQKWAGGYNYLLNLWQNMQAHAPDAMTAVLFVGGRVAPAELEPIRALGNVEIVDDPAFSSALVSRVARLGGAALGVDVLAYRAYKKARIDAVFAPAVFLGWRFPITQIVWFPDFQHRYLPHFFSASARLRRDLHTRFSASSNVALMCSSNDAREDFERFYPESTGRVHVVKFSKSLDHELRNGDINELRNRYALPSRYIYCPNQLWRHKNHTLVLEALAQIRESGKSTPTVVFSGPTKDSRDPGYFAEFTSLIDELGVSENVHVLGMIPRQDVVSLYRSCLGMLNPSLFEGWSSVVEEARCLSVPMLLSDLDVHYEQMGGAAEYFDRTSVESLATQLLRCWHLWPEHVQPHAYDPDVVSERGEAFAAAFAALLEAIK